MQICREHANSQKVREKVLVFLGGGHLGGEDMGKEFRGAEIHIHPVRMKEITLDCEINFTLKYVEYHP